MTASALIQVAGFALAFALALSGGAAALLADNAVKRLIGMLVALVAAVPALAVLGAPQPMLFAGVALAFAYTIVGVALIVRAQEDYGADEAPELDAADARDEPTDAPR